MADKQDLLRLKRLLLKDKRVRKLEDAFDRLPEYNLPIKTVYEEIERIHMTRKTRHLDKSSGSFVSDVTEGMLDDQSNRSRLTEILMSCIHALKNLNASLESLEGYLLIEYADQLGTIRTKGERANFVEHHVLSKYHKYADRTSRIKEACELVITDIDKAAWMYKNLIESIKMASGRREEL